MHFVLFSHRRGVFGIKFEDYPKGGRPPEIGDVVPLRAQKVIARDESTEEVETYLDGLYAITHLVDGSGPGIFPENGCKEVYAEISNEIYGHRVAIVKAGDLPPTARVITPIILCLD